MREIVIDTNVIFKNWYLDGPGMAVIASLIASGQCKLIVPEVVLLEIQNLYKERMAELISSIRQANGLMKSKEHIIKLPDIKAVCDAYNSILDKRLSVLKAVRLPYADVPQTAIVSRALSRKRPFHGSDKGFRDALIWESILKNCKPINPTFFITANHKDFCSETHNEQLHADLIADLKAKGYPEDCVRVYPDIKKLVDGELLKLLKTVKATERAVKELEKGRYKTFSIEEWFIENKDDIIAELNRRGDAVDILSYRNEFEDPSVTYIEDPDEIVVEEVEAVDEKTIYVTAKAISDVIIDMYIFKQDYYIIEGEPNLDVQDSDWNEDYVWAQFTAKVPVKFSITYDVENKNVDEFEVDGFDEVFGFCPFCGAAVLSDSAESCSKCGKNFF